MLCSVIVSPSCLKEPTTPFQASCGILNSFASKIFTASTFLQEYRLNIILRTSSSKKICLTHSYGHIQHLLVSTLFGFWWQHILQFTNFKLKTRGTVSVSVLKTPSLLRLWQSLLRPPEVSVHL